MAKVGYVLFVLAFSLLLCVLPIPPLPVVSFLQKYSSSSTLQTATRSYSYESTLPPKPVYTLCQANCSWEEYKPNSEFAGNSALKQAFNLEDDLKVTDMREKLACVPSSFGYNRDKAKKTFPDFQLQPCDAAWQNEPIPSLFLDTEKGEAGLECPLGAKRKYVVQPSEVSRTSQYAREELEQLWKEAKCTGKGSVATGNAEFVYGSCGEEYTNAVLRPKFRAEVYNRAKKVMQEKGKNREIRPMIVLFVTLDSFSRRHFYRKMPKTVKFLNNLNAAGHFSVFDFKVHNVVHHYSPKNMLPMFVNTTIPFHRRPVKEETTGEYSLWQIGKRLGYMTHVSFESCGSNFINYLGRELTVDHHVSSFFCAAKTFIEPLFSSSDSRRKCIGPHWAHYHLLNYTLELSRLYAGVNQFHYIHLEGAHENSGQFTAAVDEDLSEFVARYIRFLGERNDLVVMIQADHGMRFGEWQKSMEADQEFKLPVMMFLAQTELLDRLPFSYDSLWHNSFRLVSKRDFRATILDLFTVPYGEKYPVHGEDFLSKAYILHREKVKDSRLCIDAHVDPWYCSCLEVTEEIPSFLTHSFERSDIEKLLLEIVTEALRLINERSVTTKTAVAGRICQKLSFDGIRKAYGYSLNSKLEQIKVEFGVAENKSMRIEAIAVVGSDAENDLFDKVRTWNPIDPYVYLSAPTMMRVTTTADYQFFTYRPVFQPL